MAPHCVWVVVLGDFGRSPRMQYHTLSLSQAGYKVEVLALAGTPPIQAIRDEASSITIHNVPQLSPWASRLPTLAGLLLKALFQLLAMLWLMLVQLPAPAAILMQNPPAIPSMLVCWLAARRHHAAWIIDWHNFAYTIMQLKYGRHAWLIGLARAYEHRLGAAAQGHLCVTAAMQQFLEMQFGVAAALVLYDRPPDMFHRCSLAEAHDLFARLQPQLQQQGIGQCLQQQLAAVAASVAAGSGGSSTLLTTATAGGQVVPRPGRPALVVSSTSWTPDEDFGLLLAAAELYDKAAAAPGSSGAYPDTVFVITGRGPERESYLARIRQLRLHRVAFCSLWLEPGDYPLMLGAADLGVCLHTSSSGLDLPMKVVDMFGAGLPVCAVDYDCIDELVADGKTGLLFHSAEELVQQLLELLRGSPDDVHGQLARMRQEVLREHSSWRWQDNWDKVAAPLFTALTSGGGGLAAVEAPLAAAAAGKPRRRR